jgi:hypothetical protein
MGRCVTVFAIASVTVAFGSAAAAEAGEAQEHGWPKGVEIDPFAFIQAYGFYLDGPRLEAGWSRELSAAFDEKGNLYVGDMYGENLRVIRRDGRVVTLTGDNYFNHGLNADEGPACQLNISSGRGGYSSLSTAVRGVPLAGKGAIYLAFDRSVFKIWRSAERNGRWWFERIAGSVRPGAKAISGTGQSGKALDAALSGPTVQCLADGTLLIGTYSHVYRYEAGKLTCILSPEDYGREITVGVRKVKPAGWGGIGGQIHLHEPSGSFLLVGYGVIWRYRPETKSVEHFLGTDQGREGMAPGLDGKRYTGDGPTIGAQWHCGPRMPKSLPTRPEVFFPTAADHLEVRRVCRQRQSTLCKDGKWRELPGLHPPEALRIGKSWLVLDDGKTICRTYGYFCDTRIVRIRGLDLASPTVGPKLEGQ